jgi:uncharacterized protein YfcZ (UPF0381/DUF406 family)
MAKKVAGPQMFIANMLDDGRAVFLTKNGDWTKEAAKAAVAETEQELETLEALAKAAEADNHVVSVEAIAADTSGAALKPAHMKYAMQATGPSVRLDLGYQVSPNWEQ